MLRNFFRKIGEAVLWAMPLAGQERNTGAASVIYARDGRLGVHNAVKVGGEATHVSVTTSVAEWAIPADSGGIVRIVNDGEHVFFLARLVTAAVPSITVADDETFLIPAGDVVYIELNDPSVINYLSFITASGTSDIWASVVG